MNRPIRVAILHYDVNRLVNEPGNKTVMKHFGHMPNIQLLYVAAVLERLDVDICYIDMVGMNRDTQDVTYEFRKFDPDIVAISVYTSHFHLASGWAAHFKRTLPRALVLIGGVHALIFPKETLRYNPNVDLVCVGEAEVVLPELMARLRSGADLEGTPGLVFRDEQGSIRFTGPAPALTDLDSAPFPARHLVPNERYFNFISTLRNYTVCNTSRGCPFQCLFCEAGGQKWRARSAESVVAEFEECHARFGIREIDIFDSSFTISKKRVLTICRLLIQRGLHRKMIWNVRSRVDTIDKEMLEALKDAGCYRIFYGIESGNPGVLDKLRKMTDLDRIRQIIRETDHQGISAFGYFLVGSPGETRDTMQETLDFARSLPLDFAIFNCLTPYPKTPLFLDYYLPVTGHDFWADYIRSPEPTTEFVGRPWTDLEDEEIRAFAHRAMLDFYFRPRQVWRALRSIRSAEMVPRYASAALDMVVNYVGGRLRRLWRRRDHVEGG